MPPDVFQRFALTLQPCGEAPFQIVANEVIIGHEVHTDLAPRPFLVLLLRGQLAEEDESYFDAAVCRDVRAVYGPFLERYPDANYERSGYAFLLYRCGDYAGANKEIQRLGAERRIGPFGTRAKFDKIRVEAALRGK